MPHKLLLADDSPTIKRVIELTFAGEEVDVIAVTDGEQAIARIPIERPDIILADVAMPKRSGYDVAAFVKDTPELAHIPVLLLAGALEPIDQARAEQVRCDGVLVKPFEPQQVIARVRELVQGAKGNARLAAGDVPRPIDRLVERPSAETPPFKIVARRPAGTAKADPPDDLDLGSWGSSVPAAEAAALVDPVAEPMLRHPEADAGPEPPAADPNLDDYFDQLDKAFATIDAGPPTPVSVSPEEWSPEELEAGLDLPTLDSVLGSAEAATAPAVAAVEPPIVVPAQPPPAAPPSPAAVAPVPPPVEPPDTSPTLAPASPPAPSVAASAPVGAPVSIPGRNALADAFSALLAAEQGEAPDVRMPAFTTTAAAAAPAAMPAITDDLIAEVTRRVAERLGGGNLDQVVTRIVSEVSERLVREEIQRIRTKS